MPVHEPSSRIGLWLAGGGLSILAAHHWLVAYQPTLTIDGLLLLAGASTGYAITALGVYFAIRGTRTAAMTADASMLREHECNATAFSSERYDPTLYQFGAITRGMLVGFLRWCNERAPEESPWGPFDQLLREMLTEHLGAVRIRAYQVASGEVQLRGLSRSSTDGHVRCARSGILGHVATTGKEYYAADPSHGELIEQLTRDEQEPWEWIVPLQHEGRSMGLVTIGKLSDNTLANRECREDLRLLLTMFWEHVARLDQLSISEKTDKGSGLLTRGDFFTLAGDALVDSYGNNEPIVACVIALEGLRSLDDTGRWRERDELVEHIGLLIKRRIRTDDIIGRFSDDRFVVLLRRLDSGLGRLIALKIRDTVSGYIAQIGELNTKLRLRIGLAGSGYAPQPLEDLLSRAFDAVECARKNNETLYCDLTQPANDNSMSLQTPETAAL